MLLQDFNDKYIYQSDIEKFYVSDVWEIMKPDNKGIYKGDCESYCRTLKNLFGEYKEWSYYYCKIDGSGHCVLYKDDLVICCNSRKEVTLEQYHRMFNVSDFKKYNILLVGLKVFMSGLFKLVKRPISVK